MQRGRLRKQQSVPTPAFFAVAEAPVVAAPVLVESCRQSGEFGGGGVTQRGGMVTDAGLEVQRLGHMCCDARAAAPVPGDYPLLRSAVANPLMVSRMPRCTSSSVSPER